jgi:hypothetical protein
MQRNPTQKTPFFLFITSSNVQALFKSFVNVFSGHLIHFLAAITFRNKLNSVQQILSISKTKFLLPARGREEIKHGTEDTFLFVHYKFKCYSTIKSFVNVFSLFCFVVVFAAVTARGNLNMNKLSFLPLLPSLDAGLPI